MKVLVTATLRSPTLCVDPGKVVDIEDSMAEHLIAVGAARRIEAPTEPAPAAPEAAVEEPEETATEPRPARGRRGGRETAGE